MRKEAEAAVKTLLISDGPYVTDTVQNKGLKTGRYLSQVFIESSN